MGLDREGKGSSLQPLPTGPLPLQLCGKVPGMEGDGSLDPPTHPEEGGSSLGSSKVREGSRSPAGVALVWQRVVCLGSGRGGGIV